MQFISLYKPSKDNPNATRPSPEHIQKMGQLVEAEMRSGVLVATGGVKHGGHCFQVRLDGGKYSITDGPFAEAKELIGGYALLRVKSREEAVAAVKRFLELAGDGETSLHELAEFPSEK
jgi:hypothetical protein